jgi:hypothetical protein
VPRDEALAAVGKVLTNTDDPADGKAAAATIATCDKPRLVAGSHRHDATLSQALDASARSNRSWRHPPI